MVAVVGSSAAGHLLTLPVPPLTNPRLVHTVNAIAAEPGWRMLHVLGVGCRCSRSVLSHLVERGPLPDVRERVVLVGDDDGLRASLHRAGFDVEEVREESLLETIGAEAVPLLVIGAPDGTLRYVGGYTEQKQAAYIADTRTLRDLRAGRAVSPLPLFGCPASERLRRAVDPLGVR